MRFLYTLLHYLLVPWILLRLVWRARREPGYLRHVPERFGNFRQLIDAPVIWVHAVSVGETRAAQPLIEALLRRYPQYRLLITCMTPTGRETARALFGRRVERCYLPYDLPGPVMDFLEYFEPRIGILIETEIWPNLIHLCRTSGIPLHLVNARLSEKSAAGYRRLAGLTRASLRELTGIAAQSADDARRFAALGAERVTVTGNLKFEVTAPSAQLELGRTWRNLYGAERRVLLAASTRDGEEKLLLEQLGTIAAPLLLLVIAPRHPQRLQAVAELIEKFEIKFQRRSENTTIQPETRVVLGDSMGEMFAYYSACDVAFVGGSLLPYGGHNLIEACAAGKPALIGPHVYNFAEAAELAIEAGAMIQVRDVQALAREATRLLLDPEAARRMGEAGYALCRAHRGALQRVLDLIEASLQSATTPADERIQRPLSQPDPPADPTA